MDRRRVMLDAINAANECQQKAFPRPDPVDAALAALEAAGVVMVDRNLVADLIVSIEDQEVKKSFEAAWTAMLAARPK